MNTPTHMLVGAAVFARPLAPATFVAALAGGLVPDLSMFVMVLWATRVAGLPEQEVFGRLYYSDVWQTVFAIDHGLLVWGLATAFAAWSGRAVARAFAGAGLLHAAVDFLTHRDDARRQLWPLTDWVFRSPVSYWDPRYYGNVVAVVELGLVAVLAAVLWRRMQRWWQRVLTLGVAAVVVLPVVVTGGLHGLHGMG